MTYDHIYSGSTNYHLLSLILHRLAHPGGSAVLFVLNLNHTDASMTRFAKSLEEDGTFDSVRIYDEQGFWPRLALEVTGIASPTDAAAPMSRSLLPAVSKVLVPHFRSIVGDIAHDGTSWFVAADHSSFGLALVFLGTEYAQFEDHAGGFEHPDILLETMAQQNPFKHRVYTLLAEERRGCVRQHVVDTLSTESTKSTAAVEQLRMRHTLDAMSPDVLGRLLKAYGYEPEHGHSDDAEAALLITQPFARWKFLDWMQQKELYAMLVDFFVPDAKLIVKPHPRDDLTPYAQWFPAAELAPASVPMELVLTSLKPSRAITIGSTAIFPLLDSGMATVFLGAGFEKEYRQMPRLFATATAIDWLRLPSIDCEEDFPRDALQAFVSASAGVDFDAENADAKVFWAKQPTVADLEDYRILVSLSAWYARPGGVSESRLVVRRQRQGSSYVEQTLVYFYSRDERAFDNVKGMKLERNLPHLKEDLTIIFPTDDDVVSLQAQVASLQSQVRALTKIIGESGTMPTSVRRRKR